MIALDTNILLYARRAELPHHVAARALVTRQAMASQPWSLPWPCLYEYIEVITNPHAFRPPNTLAGACRCRVVRGLSERRVARRRRG